MKILGERLAKEKTNILLSAIALFLFVASGMFFLYHEMTQNRLYYLRSYQKEKEEMVGLLAEGLKAGIEKGDFGNQVKELGTNGVDKSYVGQVLYQENQLIYWKDQKNREHDEAQEIPFEPFKDELEKENKLVIYKTFEVRGIHYIYGVAIDQDYVLMAGKVDKHTTYVLLAAGLIEAIFVLVTLLLVAKLAKKEKQIKRLSKEMVKANQKNESLVLKIEQTKNLQEVRLYDSGEAHDYQRDLLYALLQRSDSEALRPMGIIIFKLDLSKRYYEKKEMQQLMDMAQAQLSKNHVFLEIGKGEFVALLYNIKEKEIEALEQKICLNWERLLKEKQLKERIVARYIDEPTVSTIELFKELQEKMNEGDQNDTN